MEAKRPVRQLTGRGGECRHGQHFAFSPCWGGGVHSSVWPDAGTL